MNRRSSRIENTGWALLIGGVFVLCIYLFLLYKQNEIIFGGKLEIDGSASVATFISGTIGTLWTLASIMFVISTLKLQREQLGQSKEIFEKQQFDNVFFNLLKLHHDFISGLSYKENIENGREFHGRDCLLFVKDYLETEFDFKESYLMDGTVRLHNKHPEYWKSQDSKIEIAKDVSKETFKYLNAILEAYINNIFSMLNILKTLPESSRIIYLEIFGGHLSKVEKFIINYYLLSTESDKHKELGMEFQVQGEISETEKLEFRLQHH